MERRVLAHPKLYRSIHESSTRQDFHPALPLAQPPTPKLSFRTRRLLQAGEESAVHLILPTNKTTCHSDRSGAAFSSSFAPANEPRREVEESLFDPSRSRASHGRAVEESLFYLCATVDASSNGRHHSSSPTSHPTHNPPPAPHSPSPPHHAPAQYAPHSKYSPPP